MCQAKVAMTQEENTMMQMSMRLEMWQECTVCRCPLHNRDFVSLVMLALSGEKPNYRVCPKCLNDLDDKASKDKNYRQRYKRFVKNKSKKNS